MDRVHADKQGKETWADSLGVYAKTIARTNHHCPSYLTFEIYFLEGNPLRHLEDWSGFAAGKSDIAFSVLKKLFSSLVANESGGLFVRFKPKLLGYES